MDILAFRLLDLHTVVYRHFLFGRYCHKKLELGVGFGWHSVSPLVISLVGIGLDGLFSFSFFCNIWRQQSSARFYTRTVIWKYEKCTNSPAYLFTIWCLLSREGAPLPALLLACLPTHDNTLSLIGSDVSKKIPY